MYKAYPEVSQLATRIPRALHRAVKLAAIADEVNVCDWVTDALVTHLRRVQDSEPAKHAPRSA